MSRTRPIVVHAPIALLANTTLITIEVPHLKPCYETTHFQFQLPRIHVELPEIKAPHHLVVGTLSQEKSKSSKESRYLMIIEQAKTHCITNITFYRIGTF